MEKIHFAIIKQYMDGWKKNDLNQIIANLLENCVVIESHGPIYRGVEAIEQWFNFWLEADSHIERWDILSFYYLTTEDTAFIEWDFSCISNQKKYAFEGMSIIKFIEQKISLIHEYRRTRKAYVWKKNKLESE